MYECPVCDQVFLYEEDLELHWQHHEEDDMYILTPNSLWHWLDSWRERVMWDVRSAVLDADIRDPHSELEYALKDMSALIELEYLEHVRGKANRILRGWEGITLPPALAAIRFD